jgi:cbb3-type cytochrome oxidase cytochrome c subunit/type II secretory pathway component PulM
VADEVKPDAGATFYDVRRLNRWFFASVAVLTVTYCMSVVRDHDREWKETQRDFADLERQGAVKQGQKAFVAAGGTKLLDGFSTADVSGGAGGGKAAATEATPVAGALSQEVERLRAQVAADTTKRPELAKALHDAQFDFDVKNAAMKKAKANFEADRFVYEEEAHEKLKPGEDPFNPPSGSEVRDAFRRFSELKQTYAEKDEQAKAAEAARDAAKKTLDQFDALAADVAAQLESREREVERLVKRADSVDVDRWFNKARNSILVNFMAPTEQPKKIVVNEIFDDLNFLTIPKVDMCITCHLATDRNKDYPAGNAHVAFGTEGNPAKFVPRDEPSHDSPAFRSHSSPELFCTSLSPHNQDRFGCSGCHQGGNQRLNFRQTFHTPTDEAEAKTWEKKYDWAHVHEWDYPMLGSQFLDASCYKCHKQQVHIPGAAKWNRGRDLVAKFGCFGCHKMAPFDGERRVGPPLGHVQSKFASLDFALKWIDEPHDFRPTTRMPSFFHRPNRATDGRDAAEITAIVTYLFNLNTPVELKKYPGNGDAEAGRKFIGDMSGVGCLGCHNIDDYKVDKLDGPRQGPDLSGIGSKVTADWLYTWIQDPKSLFPDTNMPSLRLSEQEASNLVAYLMTKRNVAFEQKAFVKPADDTVYDAILEEKLTERMTTQRAKDEIAAMSGLEKRRRAGEFLLNHYGCFGCHEIPGYEDAKPIGTELNGWGSKHADRLDFGMREMEWKEEGHFNRETWLKQKLSNTRVYDEGKDKRPFEKLKMPQFAQLAGPDLFLKDAEGHELAPGADLNAADREAVMTFVLSLVKDNTASSIQRVLSPAEASVERGRKLVREKNCIGCHVLYGEGGEIRLFSDAGAARRKAAGEELETNFERTYYPPILDGQGARTTPTFLASFLNDPSQGGGRGSKAYLRPWMKARMPTFGFTQEQVNDVVNYFAHEEVWHTSVDRALWDDLATKFRAAFPGYDEKTIKTAPADKQQLYQALIARQYRKQGGKFLHDFDFPYVALPPEQGAKEHDLARQLFETKQCIGCHMPGGVIPKGKSEADLAPDLTKARTRLAPNWVKHWFEGPGAYQPGTRMPNFWPDEPPGSGKRAPIDPNNPSADFEMALLRDYLFSSQFAHEYQAIADKVPR